MNLVALLIAPAVVAVTLDGRTTLRIGIALGAAGDNRGLVDRLQPLPWRRRGPDRQDGRPGRGGVRRGGRPPRTRRGRGGCGCGDHVSRLGGGPRVPLSPPPPPELWRDSDAGVPIAPCCPICAGPRAADPGDTRSTGVADLLGSGSAAALDRGLRPIRPLLTDTGGMAPDVTSSLALVRASSGPDPAAADPHATPAFTVRPAAGHHGTRSADSRQRQFPPPHGGSS